MKLCLIASVTLLLSSQSVTLAQDYRVHSFERKLLTNEYYSEGANAGDLNRDGVQDIVSGPFWYEGPSFERKRAIYPAVAQPKKGYADNFFSWIQDFDNDGWNDVFVVGFPGTPAYVYQNPTATHQDSAWRKHQVIDWVSNESPHFVNLVGDDRPELVCTRDGFFGFASIDWKKPFETWQFHPISERIADKKFGHGLGVGDVNWDGLQDVIYSGGWLEQPRENPNSSRWAVHRHTFTTSYGGAEMHAYDVDGDGDQDIITSDAAHDFGLIWFEQRKSGDETEFVKHTIMGEHPSQNRYGLVFSELHSVQLVDVDGDGLKDIVTGKTYYSHHEKSPMWDAGAVVYWFRLVRGEEGVDWIPYRADSESGIGRQISIADLNSDGLVDFVVGGMKGCFALQHRVAKVDEATWKSAQPSKYVGPAQPTTGAMKRGPKLPLDDAGKTPGAIEAEGLSMDWKVTQGTASIQSMKGFSQNRWSGDAQLFWTGAQPSARLALSLDAMQAFDTLDIGMTSAKDYATIQLWFDQQKLGEPIDLYSPQVNSTGLHSFALPQKKAGKYTFEIEILGANPAAVKSYMVGLDCIRFRSKSDPRPESDAGLLVTDENGRALNLDFETGTLQDWEAQGAAFKGQPIRGDTVNQRRTDMRSNHQGEYWIGGFEKSGDQPQGTLTSIAFQVKEPFASFWMNGGQHDKTRIELSRDGLDRPFFEVSGKNDEGLEQIIVDLRAHLGAKIRIRIVDEHSGGWGHINFDHFRFHRERPGQLTSTSIRLTADNYPHAGLNAQEAARAMRVPQGFSVKVFASEPDIMQPIAMAIDDRGRVWVAEAYEYPQRAKDEKNARDRILIFEDENGDGTFDRRTVFADGLNLVSGLEVGFGGVWVGAAPYLMFIPDRNKDDRPDSEPVILLDGWGYEDTHETLNAFIWGPDGWLYGCHGVFTHSKVGKPGTPADQRIRLNAGIWRYHPTRHVFEVFAHGTSNPWGVDFNDHGQAFCTACVIPHLYHIIQGARYQRQAGQHFNLHTYQDITTIADHLHYLGATPHGGNGKSDEAGGGHAHAGAMIYLGDKWPIEYRNQIFMNNIHGQRLNVDRLTPKGSGYVGQHSPDFLFTDDQASQILNLRYGPDGQAYMIDWYDMQACHLKESSKHDRSNGRIYKIQYGDSVASSVNLKNNTDRELAELMLHQNDWYVRHGRRVLQERATSGKLDEQAVLRLREIASQFPDDTRRLRALWTLHACNLLSTEQLLQSTRDSSGYVRAWSIQFLTEQPKETFDERVVGRFQQMAAQDSSQVVRLYLASALQRMPLQQRWLIAEALGKHSLDRDDHNLPLMLWYALEPLAETDPRRALTLSLSLGEKIPLIRSFMLKRIGSSSVPNEALTILVDGLANADSTKLRLTFLDAIKNSLRGQRQSQAPANWNKTLEVLNQSKESEVVRQANALAVVFGDQGAKVELRKQILNEGLDVKQRQDAIETLMASKDTELVNPLISLLDHPRLRHISIQGLAQYDDPRIANTLLEKYSDWNSEEKRMALGTLAGRVPSAKKLLEAVESKKIPVSDLSADLARQIDFLNDASLKQKLEAVWGQVRTSDSQRLQMIAEYTKLVSDKSFAPDLSLGRAIFHKTCQNCHVLYGIGATIGPDLTGSNRSNLEYLLSNIVDPSTVMAKEYQPTILLTEDGQVLSGIVKGEDDKSVTLQTATYMVTTPKMEIVKRTLSDKSMMPEDQLKQFSHHEIRSLVAYLGSKKQTPQNITAETSSLFFNQKNLLYWNGNHDLWNVESGEIVGKTTGLNENEFLVSDFQSKNFRLAVDVKLIDNAGNSGIQFRSQSRDRSVQGYQADVGKGWWGKLYEEHGRGLLWETSGETHVKLGDWNRYEIEAIGSRVKTWINGERCVDLDDVQGARQGIFALQLHSGGPTEVRFRNFELKVLPDE